MSLKRAFCHYRAFGEGKRWAKILQSGLLWMSWEEERNHYNPPCFSLPRHKARAGRNMSKDKSRNSSSDRSLSLCIISWSITSKASFLRAWKYLATLCSSIPLYHFFGNKGKKGLLPRQCISSPGRCLPTGLGPVFCPTYALQCVLPLFFKKQLHWWLIFCAPPHLLVL